MIMKHVESSNIDSVGYDVDRKDMYVKFKSGKTFAYQSVTPEIHKSLVEAKSIGKYFIAKIKNAGFHGTEVLKPE